MIEYPKWWDAAIHALKDDTNGVLAAVVIFAGMTMIAFGGNPWWALGFPGTIYIVYGLKSILDNSHERKMAEFEVQKLEVERGKAVAAKTRRALEKRQDRRGRQ